MDGERQYAPASDLALSHQDISLYIYLRGREVATDYSAVHFLDVELQNQSCVKLTHWQGLFFFSINPVMFSISDIYKD